MASEIINLDSAVQTVLNAASKITMSLSLDSGVATTINMGSDISLSMALSSLLELEET